MADQSLGPGPTSHSFVSQRLRLHYVDYGNHDAPLLVLVHGNRDHCRSWDPVAAQLRDRYHVIAPDLRGHGDSAWAMGAQYGILDFTLDLAQLLRRWKGHPITLVGHSLGGAVVLQYSGVFPENIVQVCAMEGLGPAPSSMDQRPAWQRIGDWVEVMQKTAAHQPKRYADIDEAVARMRDANPHLSEEMARHLTVHGVMEAEDGSLVWKFDPYVRSWPPYKYDEEGVRGLWGRIPCPVLLVRGAESWASNPVDDGRAGAFQNYTYAEISGAGHWAHHDRFEEFMGRLEGFLLEKKG